MLTKPYSELDELTLLALAIYREARGESLYGKRAVGHVIKNRVLNPGWWGASYHSVILKPWQFSSFNQNDPNADVWPPESATSWADSLAAASAVLLGDEPDSTDGATYYHDTSMGWPNAWGKESDYVNTLNIGRLRFYRPL